MTSTPSRDTVRRRSGWLVPAVVFAATTAFSAIFLIYYLAPQPASMIQERSQPTTHSDHIGLSINSLYLAIPENYLPYPSTRYGGRFDHVEMFTVFPTFSGYSDWDAAQFTDNRPDSPAIYMLLRREPFRISEADRFSRIYLSYVSDRGGAHSAFGLSEFRFRDDTGYRGEDLFVGHVAGETVVMRCTRPSEQVQSPSCIRDTRLPHGVALTYRFKRSSLGHWKEIAIGVEKLVHGFMINEK